MARLRDDCSAIAYQRRTTWSAWAALSGERIVISLVVALVGLGGLACSSERSVTPLPVSYRLYAIAAIGGGMAIDVIDAEADSVMRRIPSAGLNSPDDLEISADGRYLVTFSGGVTSGISLFDLRTESIVASNLINTEYAAFVNATPLLAGILRDSIIVYTTPDLSIDTVIPSDIVYFVRTNKPRELLGVSRHVTPTYYGIRRYSAENWKLIDSFSLHSPVTNGPMAAFQAATSPDGERLYVLGGDGNGAAVFALELESHRIIFRQPVETFYGWIQVSPDGDEVWITQSFPAMFRPRPDHLGYVLMMDANTGSPIDTLKTLGMNANYPDEPLALQHIRFHPSGLKAFVTAFWGRPAILVVEVKTKEPSSMLYDQVPNDLWDIAIGPCLE